MLKLTMRPEEYIQIGENIKVIFVGGSKNNIHIMIDAPKECSIVRSPAKEKKYYIDEDLSWKYPKKLPQSKNKVIN